MAVNINVVKPGTFERIVYGAGIILPGEDLEALKGGTFTPDNILFNLDASGFNAYCKCTPKDLADDVAGANLNTKGYEAQENWDIGASGTAIEVTPETVALNMSFADVTTVGNVKTVKPRKKIELSDYQDLLFVVKKTDETLVYCLLKNARSQEGFSMQTTDKDKSKFPFSFKAYFDDAAPNEIPFEYGEITEAETPAQG